MTAHHMREMLAHPPPLEMDLIDADRTVGWIIRDTIGFRGFESETEAIHASWVAHRTLARRLARTHGVRLVPVDVEPLALQGRGAEKHDTILASNRPIATLIRPGSHSRVDGSFGFEIAVPFPMSELQLRGLAYLMYRTLRKSGVRWALWRAHAPGRAKRMTEGAHAIAASTREPIRGSRQRSAWDVATRPLQRIGNWLRLTTERFVGSSHDTRPSTL